MEMTERLCFSENCSEKNCVSSKILQNIFSATVSLWVTITTHALIYILPYQVATADSWVQQHGEAVRFILMIQ